jgi:hypothetical protein
MPAQNTDKFLKVAQNKGWQLGSGGIPDASVASFSLVSALDIPTDTAVLLTIDRVDANKKATPTKMERLIGVMSGDNVTNCTRGVAGTAQQHNPGAVVEIVVDAVHVNRFIEGFLAEHTQLGGHNMQDFDESHYAADAGSTDTYAITLAPVPAAYYVGMVVVFKANTANTGAATLNVNALGAKTIKKNKDKDLADNDIESGQMVTVIYDGTYFQMQSQVPVIVKPKTNTVASDAVPAINTDTTDIFTITALAVAITSMTTNLTGTPVNGQKLTVRFKDNGAARAITWGASFASRGATLPTTTVLGKYLYVGFIYNSTAAVWDCVAVSQEV